MPRVLVISSEFPPGPGGIGQHTASMVLTLKSQFDIDVLCNQDYADKSEIDQFNDALPTSVRVINFIGRDKSFHTLRRIFQAVRLSNGEYGRIILSGRLPLWIGFFIKLFLKRETHAFIHGFEVNQSSFLISRFTELSYRAADYLYPVSSFTGTFLNPSKKQEVKVIPNGLDESFFDLCQEVKGIKVDGLKGYPSILTVGNVTRRKGQHRVIKALPAILEKFPEAHYHIVGLPTQKEEFVGIANELGVLDSITFHGRVPSKLDLIQKYKGADIFIMLSENQSNGDVEGFGIAILEANAVGVPAIGALGCGIEDAVGDNNGLLVDGDNAGEISEAVEAILSQKERYRKGAVAWAQKHKWQELVKEML